MAIVRNSSSLDMINQVAMKKIMPQINDQIFKANPLLNYLRGRNTWKMKAYDIFRLARMHGYKNPYKVQYPNANSSWNMTDVMEVR